MANCVRHEELGQEKLAKWPRRGSRFCTEPCAALWALDTLEERDANPIVTKDVAPGRPHARGHTTGQAPGDPTQAVGTPRATGTPRHAPTEAPTAVAEPDGGDDGIVQGDGLDDMTKDALKSECESLGLAVGGTKDDLIARIRDHHDAD